MSNSAPPTDGLESGSFAADTQTMKQNTKEASFSSPDELVTFYIGPDLKRFQIHKEVACLHSPVFKAAFNSNFIEGQTQTYMIEDADTEAFQYLVQWLYSQKFKTLAISPADLKIWHEIGREHLSRPISQTTLEQEYAQLKKMSDPNLLEKMRDRLSAMCRVWVLADRLQIPRIQNLAIDDIHRMNIEWNFGCISVVNLVYDAEQLAVFKGAALREYVMESCRKSVSIERLGGCPDMFHKEMLLECLIANKTTSEGYDPFKDRADFKRRFHVPEDVYFGSGRA